MKFYSAHHFNWILLIFLIGIGCTAAGELTDELPEEPRDEILIETDENTSHIPEWYRPARFSDADSSAIYGYAYVVSDDPDEALELSKATAEKFLSFEMDRQLEQARSVMETDGYEEAGDPRLILQLRNFAANINVEEVAKLKTEQPADEGDQYEIYARYKLLRSDLYTLLESQLSDQKFLRQLRDYSANRGV